jgi:HTH-type transcriptional repressor of NAD biosynthesis genes
MEAIGDRSRRGLIIGKFLPPHRGQLHLVDEARKRVGHLTVLVCTLEQEPIPGRLRHAWMRELCPEVEVLHVTDENPQEPGEHPDFWDIWCETIRRHCGSALDVLFSSEAYGDELGRRLGIPHEAIDRERRAVPISGTAIRERPLAHWGYIPEAVRPYFVRRVVVTGSESTGKTTLARDLARHFDTLWTPEYGRVYLDETARPFATEDMEPIARGQIALEEDARRRANRIVVQDTDLVSTVVYSRHYHGTCPAWIEERSRSRRADLYLLLDTDVAWVADPQRDRPHLRREMQEHFRASLEERGCPIVEVSGTWEARFAQAVAAVRARFGIDE